METQKLSWGSSLTYIINSLFGAGFLALPYVFAHAGWLLTIVASVILTFLNFISYSCHIETMARMEAYLQSMEQNRLKAPSHIDLTRYNSSEPTTISPLLENSTSEPTITDRKLEVSDLCYLSLGSKYERIYLLTFSLCKYGGLTSAAILWGTGLAGVLGIPGVFDPCDVYEGDPQCRDAYSFWIVLYAFVVVPITMMEFHSQAWIQVAGTILRVALVGFMLVFSLVIIVFGSRSSDGYPSSELPQTWDWIQFGSLVPILIFGSAFQPNIPIITNHLEKREKNVKSLYEVAIAGNATFLLVFGFIVAYAFGSDLSRQANLNWSTYIHTSTDIFLIILSALILISPSLNGIGTYSIRSIVLAENIAGTCGVSLENRKLKKTKVLFRLMVALPPLVAALLIYDLTAVLSWTGLLLFPVFFTIPSLFHIEAKRLIPQASPFDTSVTSTKWSYFLLISSSILFVACTWQKIAVYSS